MSKYTHNINFKKKKKFWYDILNKLTFNILTKKIY